MEVLDVTADMNELSSDRIARKNLIPIFEVSCNVKNCSDKDAKETVQLYVATAETILSGGLKRPVKELRGFDKKLIPAGDEMTYHFSLTPEAFSYYDVSRHCYVAPKGTYDILLASSSKDIRLSHKITLNKEYMISRS